MRFLTLLLTISFAVPAIADGPARHAPIHDSSRVFTADEFRTFLKARTLGRALESMSRQPRLSEEARKQLAEFAQKLVEQSQSPGEKKDLPIPEELLKHPALREFLEDEEKLEQLLKNKALMDLAERIAKNYKLPNVAPRRRGSNVARPDGGGVGGTPSRSDTAGEATRPGGDASASGRASQGVSRADSGRPDGSDGDSFKEEAEPPKSVVDGSKSGQAVGSARPDGSESRRADGGQPGADASVARGSAAVANSDGGESVGGSGGSSAGNSMLRRWAEKAQRLGPLQDSEALQRFGSRLEEAAGERVHGGSPVGSSSPPAWLTPPEGSTLDPWLDRFGQMSVKQIPLPAKFAEFSLSLGNVPLPRLPALPVGISGRVPRMPTFGMSPPSVREVQVLGILLVGITGFFLLAMLLRVRVGRFLTLGRGGSSHALLHKPRMPLDPSDRASIQAWFEYLVVFVLGESARTRNHVVIATSLEEKDTVEAKSARELVGLYEQARYTPPDEPLGSKSGTS